MRRPLLVVGVVIAALVAAAPTAGAQVPRRGVLFYTRVDGFYVEGREAPGSGRIRLWLERHGEAAYYYVRAQVGDGTVSARFGRLGTVDLDFTPGRGDGPLGCGHEDGGWQRGSFHGAIVFRGEHDYADIDADSARGWFATLPREGCGVDRRHAPRPVAARASEVGPIAETGARLEAWTSRRFPGRVFYVAPFYHRQDERVVDFGAFRDERREGMTIGRGAEALAGAKSFEWNLRTGTARVEPPAPFGGRAFYRRRGPDGRPSWTGNLSVPVLGGKPMRLTGSAFEAHLGRAS